MEKTTRERENWKFEIVHISIFILALLFFWFVIWFRIRIFFMHFLLVIYLCLCFEHSRALLDLLLLFLVKLYLFFWFLVLLIFSLLFFPFLCFLTFVVFFLPSLLLEYNFFFVVCISLSSEYFLCLFFSLFYIEKNTEKERKK